MPNKKVLSRTNSGTPASITGSRKSNESFDTLDEEELLVEECEENSEEGDENRSKVCVAR